MNDEIDHDTFLINYDKLCANVDIHMNSFKKVQLWIFQNSENCSSINH